MTRRLKRGKKKYRSHQRTAVVAVRIAMVAVVHTACCSGDGVCETNSEETRIIIIYCTTSYRETETSVGRQVQNDTRPRSGCEGARRWGWEGREHTCIRRPGGGESKGLP